MYIKDGKFSQRKAGEQLDVSIPTVRRIARKLGIDYKGGLSQESIDQMKEFRIKNPSPRRGPYKIHRSAESIAKEMGCSGATIRNYAHKLGVDFSSEEGLAKIKEAWMNKTGSSSLDNNGRFNLRQVGRQLEIHPTTLRSFFLTRGLGQRIAGKFLVDEKEIAQAQEHYATAPVKKWSKTETEPKITLQDLVSKSEYLVYVPGVKQLSGFADIDHQTFVQPLGRSDTYPANSNATGLINISDNGAYLGCANINRS